MTVPCPACGAALPDDAAFCTSCGRARATAPAAWPPPPGAPAVPPTTAPMPAGASRVLSLVLGGNWLGSLVTAAAVVLAAGLGATILGLLFKPDDFGLRNTFTLIAVWTTGALGGRGFLSFDASGTLGEDSGSLDMGMGFVGLPLTLTLLSLSVGAFVFRRVTAQYSSGFAAWIDGIRAALIAAFAFMVIALAFRSDAEALGADLTRELGGLLDIRFDADFTLGASAVSSFFMPLLVLSIFFGLVTLTRAGWWGRRAAAVQAWVGVPLRSFGYLALLLPLAGLIAYAVLWGVGDGASGSDVSGVDEWLTIIAGGIAYATNVGIFLVSLGAAGTVGMSMSGSSSGFDGLGAQHESEWAALSTLTGEGNEPGLWIAVLVTPLWLLAGVLLAQRSGGAGAPKATPGQRGRWLAAWAVLLPVALVVMFWLANLRYSLDMDYAAQGDSGSMSMDLVAGANTWRGTGFLLLYGLAIALAVGYVTGVVNLAALQPTVAPGQTFAPPGYAPPGHAQPGHAQPGYAPPSVGEQPSTGQQWGAPPLPDAWATGPGTEPTPPPGTGSTPQV